MNLNSERLYLRPIAYEDTDLVLQWRNSKDVKRYFLHQEDITREEHINWLNNKVFKGKVCQFIICLCEDDRPIGSIYIQGIDPVQKQGEYGVFIGDNRELSKGYGTEASYLLIDYAFHVLDLKTLNLRVLSDNKRAISSYKKLGFVLDESSSNDMQGVLRMHLSRSDI